MRRTWVMLTAMMVLLTFPLSVSACTTVIVGKNLTEDGSVMMARNEDMDDDDVGRIYLVEEAEHLPDETVWLAWETLPQVPKTARYWAAGNWDKVKYDGDILGGMNEHGVAMACNSIRTNYEPMPEKTGLKRYSLRQLILERAVSARDGVDLLAAMLEKYGQGGTSGVDTTYFIVDRTEGWVVETTAREWVALRVPDDGFIFSANEVWIEDNWDLASPGIMKKTADNGGKKVNFKQEYGFTGESAWRVGQLWNTARTERGKALLAEKGDKITVPFLLSLLRDHFEGTDRAGSPIHPSWEDCTAGETPKRARPICAKACQEFTIWSLRADLPLEVGMRMWYGSSSPCVSTITPIYMGTTAVPAPFVAQDHFYSRNSAWWVFETIQRLADKDYENVIGMIRAGWQPYESAVLAEANSVEKQAAEEYAKGNVEAGRALLTRFSYTSMENALLTAHRLVDKLTGIAINAPMEPGTR